MCRHRVRAPPERGGRRLPASSGVAFFDAGSVITTHGVDGVHLTADTDRDLGAAPAPAVGASL
ncbi:hypothetical protein [Nakamurella deserti]|uniref:hypothetical protein n=1 Tax=Nakamurella deserti TaxID=2164074 RepID=UPI0013008FFD|nr:hypothetical protein [Nakamurella deserti]